jgi:hypothetical protein
MHFFEYLWFSPLSLEVMAFLNYLSGFAYKDLRCALTGLRLPIVWKL